jgi:hypothetical protein
LSLENSPVSSDFILPLGVKDVFFLGSKKSMQLPPKWFGPIMGSLGISQGNSVELFERL